jgi:hypothetical protein
VETYIGIIELGKIILSGMTERRADKVEKLNALL